MDDYDEEMDQGPWTEEEDSMLRAYVHIHGEGRWNSVARLSGLRGNGKSCRIRWLNYLRPEVRGGNMSLEEQLLIFELHSRWGNRWSKIAQHLPGRTETEIENYWRTRVESPLDCMSHLCIPRLMERIRAKSDQPSSSEPAT